jgi:hypothetical protein
VVEYENENEMSRRNMKGSDGVRQVLLEYLLELVDEVAYEI